MPQLEPGTRLKQVILEYLMKVRCSDDLRSVFQVQQMIEYTAGKANTVYVNESIAIRCDIL